jgi:hypothetical protein
MALDLDHSRSQFPSVASGYLFGDNAGGSQVLLLSDRLLTFLSTPSRSVSKLSPIVSMTISQTPTYS